MGQSARQLLDRIRDEVADEHGENRFVPLVESGQAPLTSIGALAVEESRIVPGDWRSFLTLAANADTPAARGFFTSLAQGEGLVLPLLEPLARKSGVDPEKYRYRPGCQAYASYVAWLALNTNPAVAAVAMLTNFAAWGEYCGRISTGLQAHYGFTPEDTAFFDFFATPVPELEQQGLAAVQAGLDANVDFDHAVEHVRLLQGYELMFWNTLADTP
ncbi:MAG: transcriptional regulator [Saccharothrix sp.]|nr:transcriptional regulator [Saccharothrix sp.]